MNSISDEILEDDGFDQGNNGLPQFLNVLTILTFIGSGLTLVLGIYNIFTEEQQREQIAEARRLLKNSPFSFSENMMDGAEIMLDNLYVMQGSAILVSIVCLIGAFMMRKLQKNGFYLYVAASVVSIAVPLAVIGFGFMGGMVLFGSIFSIAFVIMYGVNLKYLK